MSTLGLHLAILLVSADPTATDPRPIIEKSIQAHGGAAKLVAVKAYRSQMKGSTLIGDKSVPFTSAAVVQFPTRLRTELVLDLLNRQFHIIRTYDGGTGWRKMVGQVKPLEGEDLDAMKESVHFMRVSLLVPLLEDKQYQLKVIGEDQVDGKPVVGIRVSAQGQRDIDIYFDKASGLLVKSVSMATNPGFKDVKRETFYREFKEFDGVKYATKVRMLQNGEKFLEGEIIALDHLNKVDDKEFGKPEP